MEEMLVYLHCISGTFLLQILVILNLLTLVVQCVSVETHPTNNVSLLLVNLRCQTVIA